jgi:hypothetical protein
LKVLAYCETTHNSTIPDFCPNLFLKFKSISGTAHGKKIVTDACPHPNIMHHMYSTSGAMNFNVSDALRNGGYVHHSGTTVSNQCIRNGKSIDIIK